jgi:hexokinase
VNKMNKRDMANIIHNQFLQFNKFQFMKDELKNITAIFQSLMDKDGFAEQGTQLPAIQAWLVTVPQPVKAAKFAPAAA